MPQRRSIDATRSANGTSAPPEPPPELLPFLSLGVDLRWQGARAGRAPGPCPFCGRDDKFSVNTSTGQWNCWHGNCADFHGNGRGFLRHLWEQSRRQPPRGLAEFAARRGLPPESLDAWGLCRSLITDDWLLPGYNGEGVLCQLYRWVPTPGGAGKGRFYATEGLAHGLHLPTLHHDAKRKEAYVCEGPWDGMALWQALRDAGRRANVCAVPGCGVFAPSWCRLFAGRDVALLYDNDHPRQANGRAAEGGGLAGMKRAARLLAGSERPPSSIRYLHWGPEGWNPDLPSGWDVRDHLRQT